MIAERFIPFYANWAMGGFTFPIRPGDSWLRDWYVMDDFGNALISNLEWDDQNGDPH